MSKRHRNAPHPGYFKVAGGAVEEPDVARQAKQAVAREKARMKKRPAHPPIEPPRPVASMKHELEVEEAPVETLATPTPGVLRMVAGAAIGVVRFAFGLPGRLVRMPLRVIDRLRHLDQLHSA